LDSNPKGIQREKILILLLGGTSETAPIATALAEAGFPILVSTATDNELIVGHHLGIKRRTGRMDHDEMATLIKKRSFQAIVDATHPFAETARATARRVAADMKLSYFTFIRAGMEYGYEKITPVKNHSEAAAKAFGFRRPVFLTIGSRNLAPYLELSRKKGVKMLARVLPHHESMEVCHKAGFTEEEMITGRGPFSVDENLEIIRKFNIGTIVSKDSGREGGVPEKVESARIEGCNLVLIERPEQLFPNAYGSVNELVVAVKIVFGKKGKYA
jgi:precorrin-6A/cobalt-precorrin-6A reductase